MSLTVKIRRHIDVTIFEFNGRVTLGEGAVLLRGAVREALWNGYRKLAFNYGGVTYQDSSATGELVAAQTMVRNSGGELVLFDLPKKARDLLLVTRLFTVFEVFQSIDEALAHFDSGRKRTIKVTAKRYFDVSVLNIEGALTLETIDPKLPGTALSSGATSVIVLCPQLLEIDLTGAQELIALKRSVRQSAGDLVLAGIEPRLMPEVLATHVLDEIASYETVDLAMKAFGLALNREKWAVEAIRAV
jgi:anti-sigma B factor antagonist